MSSSVLRAIAFGIAVAAASSTSSAELHYAAAENLERLDVQRLDTARKTIDMAAYVLMDWVVIGALTAVAYRGVKVRL